VQAQGEVQVQGGAQASSLSGLTHVHTSQPSSLEQLPETGLPTATLPSSQIHVHRPEDICAIQDEVWPGGRVCPTADSDEEAIDAGQLACEELEELEDAEESQGDEALSSEDDDGISFADCLHEELLAEARKHGA
jgi:hypothetical protein